VPGRDERTFRAAGAACVAAFLAGVACVALSVWYMIKEHHTTYVVVVVFFGLQLALLTLAAVQVFTQAIYRSGPRRPAAGDVTADRARSSGSGPRPGQ
jgi:integral membrane sensor domain MASE1